MKTLNKTFYSLKLAALTAAAIAGVSSGCANREPHFSIMGKSQGFLASTVNKKVDILWVIDNSGTMGPKQTNLANSINSFMNSFVAKNFDYQIGVTTTDIGGQGACLVGATKIITPSTVNPVNTLATNAQVGFFGAAAAKALDAAQKALSAPNSTGCNAGFLRSDAFLAVIFFSDADDNDSVNSVTSTITFLDSIKPPVSTPNGGSYRNYFASSMVSPDKNSAACVALGPFTETGLKFLDISSRTGGPVANICDADFSAGLLAVSTKILERTTAVRLASSPDEATIQVFQNGVTISADAVNGWTFESSSNSIIFHGTAIPTEANTLITVNFIPIDIVR